MFYRVAVFSTWRQCGGNIAVLLWGIFSLADTGLSGLYYPLSNTKCHQDHQDPVLSSSMTLSLSLCARL